MKFTDSEQATRSHKASDDGNDAVRAALDKLIADRGTSYSAISNMLGRNPAYIHQFIHRGSPQRLAENDRRFLAEFFAVDEALLGADKSISQKQSMRQAQRGPLRARTETLRAIPKLSVGASAGQGALTGDEYAIGQIGFDEGWLRKQGLAKAQLSMISVEGDSMEPTLRNGDDILLALSGDDGRPFMAKRDGIYVLRMDDSLMVKRLSFAPDGRLSVISDNKVYPSRHGLMRDQVHIVGQVVWTGRML